MSVSESNREFRIYFKVYESDTLYSNSTEWSSASDLTGTTWSINENYGTTQLPLKYINFTSNNINYDGIYMEYDDGDYYLVYASYNSNPSFITVVAYYPGYWFENYDDYKTITITGGSDATNSTLINWLEANATQIIQPSAHTQVGTSTIASKHFGSLPIVKEVLNGVTIYEVAPSG